MELKVGDRVKVLLCLQKDVQDKYCDGSMLDSIRSK